MCSKSTTITGLFTLLSSCFKNLNTRGVLQQKVRFPLFCYPELHQDYRSFQKSDYEVQQNQTKTVSFASCSRARFAPPSLFPLNLSLRWLMMTMTLHYAQGSSLGA